MVDKVEAKIKINSQLFSALGQNLRSPFFVLDRNGRILFSNEVAEKLLQSSEKDKILFNFFDEKSSKKLRDLLTEHLLTESLNAKLLDLKLTTGEEIKARVTFTSYAEKRESFIFCSFKSVELSIKPSDVTGINVKSDDYKKLINNKQIIKIIHEIKSLYPFTFIGKEKLRKEIDKLSELFWIKDKFGTINLVNKKFADKIGVNPTILEGQKYNEFIPAHLVNFYQSIDEYINDSLNCIIVEGTPVKSLLQFQNYQTIQVPLNDADNNVIAQICITQKIKEKEVKLTGSELFELNPKLLDEYPRAIALFDESGLLKQKSNQFSKLFLKKLSSRKKILFQEIFPVEITDKINSFLESSTESEKYSLTVDKSEEKENRKTYEVILHKLKFEKSKVNGFIFEASPVVITDDFESILKRRGKMFDILIQNNPEPIFIYDKDNLKFLEVNEAALDLYGFRKDEFLEMDLTDLYTPDDIQTLLDTSSDSQLKKTQFKGPYRHRRKDGSIVFVEISKISFTYQGKEAHFNIVKDITKNLTLEMENQEYKAVFDNTTDLLFTTDQTGFIKYANNKAVKFLDSTNKKIIGESFISLFVDEDRSKINNSIFKSSSIEPVNINGKIRSKKGDSENIDLTATPILDFEGNIDTFTIIGVTKQETVKHLIVDKSSNNFSKEKQQVDSLFFSSLFHEILTPINVILGFIQDITDNIKDLSPEQKETTKIIDQNRERLLETMNSVIEYSNILNNEVDLNISKVGIPEIIDTIQKKNDTTDDNQKKEFTYGKISSSLTFETDLQRFKLLAFLLFKIISRLSTKDKLYFSAVTFDDNNFLISVKDSYAAISEELFEKIDKMFSSDENVSSDVFGLSVLTISLAKALLKLLKGKFYTDETDNKNCGFIFPINFKIETAPEKDKKVTAKKEIVKKDKTDEKLVVSGEEPKISTTEEIEGPTFEETYKIKTIDNGDKATKEKMFTSKGDFDLSELKCLYIEDQVDSQILFKVQLKGLKEIKYAVSFEESLPLLDANLFDFIVMDINLQGEYNGLDALKIIKKMPGYENTPIIAVTAYVLPGDREKFIATGFEDFISKPIFRDKMVSTLERIFVQHAKN